MLNEIFYQKCLGCGLRSDNNSPVCIDCMQDIEKHPYACESCGYPSSLQVKICGKCSSAIFRDRIFIPYKYQGPIKKLIKEIKFLYRASGRSILHELIDTNTLIGYDVITDVPSHFTRKIRRLKHPATDIAKSIASSTGARYDVLLARVKKTEYQYKLKRRQRAFNVKGAFTIKTDVTGLKILLVDDIITTGSTIEECSRTLKRSGASIVDVFALTGGSTK
ncbi:MAG: ComF family protein [Denitrovibrio sp.]|nr:MAG: ComF family protein [Denitrovibrio sp.]